MRTRIILDVGSTHCGKLAYCKEAIDLSVVIGCELKFQLFKGERFTDAGNIELPYEMWPEIWEYAQKQKKAQQVLFTEKITIQDKKISELSEKIQKFSNQTDDNQRRSMQNNVIIHGIIEKEKESVSEKIQDFLETELKIGKEEVSGMNIDRCHRLGQKKEGKQRPVIVRFTQHMAKEHIFSKVSNLKGKNFSVQHQFSIETLKRRAELIKVMREEREKGNICKLQADKLFINGKLYGGGGEN